MRLEGSCHCGAVRFSVDSKADWVRVDAREGEPQCASYYPHSLDEWHRKHGLLDDD